MAIQNHFGDAMPIFDGNNSIYCTKPLPFNDEGEIKEITLEANGLCKEKTFHITIRKVEEINIERLLNYLKGSAPLTGEIQTCVTILNTVLNYKPRNNFAVVKRGVFPESNNRPKYLYGGIELKTGFCQSMRPGWGYMVVNIDICAAVFHPHGSLLDYVVKILGKRNVEELRRGINDNERRCLERSFKGLQIKVIHRGEKQQKYKIERLTSQAADFTTFTNKKEGVEMNVADYFAQTYNHSLKFKSLPCIVVKKNLFIPIEVCDILPGQKYEKMIGDRAKADMIKFTACKPQERFDQIENGIRNVFKQNDDENLRDFGIKVDPKMMIVDARVLKSPTVMFNANSKLPNTFSVQNGRWNLRDLVLLRTKPLHNWSVLVLTDKRTCSIDQVKRCMSGLKQKLVEFGMEVGNDPYINYGNPQGNIEASMQIAVQKAHINKSFPPQLIIVVIPRKPSPLYGEVKMVADTKIGIVTQCILADKLRNPNNKSLWANIGLKINAKLGGHNCNLIKEELSTIGKVPTMIVGADISHPGVGQKDQPSIAAVCASVEPNATTYYGRVSVNKQIRNEMIECLGDMISDLLKAFYEKNKVLPKRMIFYRDGVSEGQFRSVLNREVIALKNAFDKIYQKDLPKLTFIIAQKRHHTRFVPLDRRDTDKLGNCIPGTVVDQSIVHCKEFDFYLQSHSGLQGTTRPTHYYVLHDENNFSADDIQNLTYRLSYLYARCSSAISVVPPIAYAHLLAARARLYPINEVTGEKNCGESSNCESTFSIPLVSKELAKVMYFI
ncbi:Piwi domain-containing protein [Glomus cerebriforme]|uniref:Piwi domain-containing protein n=1 Tax=Glomus cerebriforme TaxID=658196 RepID=A0A397T3S1_9GLOM|nr:Piwi domain-containing protein [Glomus cerebriforme]